MNYRPEIDGLRAIAVLPVILFHAGIGIFSGGFVGVDVFFVISGYLITKIILADLEQDKFRIVKFYERRARRILPALFFVVFSCLPFAYFTLSPNALVDFGQSLVAVPTFLSNVLFWSERGYFGGATELKPLIHTWSLAVEEQFYLVFPFILMLVWYYLRRWTGPFIMLTIACSLYLSWFLTELHFETAFYLPFARAWELMVGAAAAFYGIRLANLGNKYSGILSISGLSLIFYAVLNFDGATSFPGYAAVVPVFGTFLLIIAGPSSNVVNRALASPWLVKIGLVSYSLYLWHQPIFVFFRYLNFSDYIIIFGIPLSMVLSLFTYRFIETPFRDKTKFSMKNIFIYSVVASSASIVFGMILIFNDGFLNRYAEADQKILKQFVNQGNYNQTRFDQLEMKAFNGDSKRRVLVVGDSYAKDLINVMYEGGMDKVIQFSTKQINSECGNSYTTRNIDAFIPENRVRRCEWMGRYEDPSMRSLMAEADEIWLANSWLDWVVDLMPETLAALSVEFDAEIKVFGSKSFGDISSSKILKINPSQRTLYKQASSSEVLATNQKLKAIIPADNFVDLSVVSCGGDVAQCAIFTQEGLLISSDGGHLTKAGAKHLSVGFMNLLSLPLPAPLK
ncbi:acyltransferase [Gammaproteobacteria bacterium]|nr:acyltransferase [Gammaproteobacteria bacterium]